MFKKIVMIGGMPRSGTTLLSKCIQEKMDIPVSPETHYFNNSARHGKKLILSKLPSPVLQDPRVGPAYEELSGVEIENKIKIFEQLLEKIFKDEYDVVGEKTPAHLMYFSKIARESERYVFVVMQRSCADVCNSLKIVPWNNSSVFRNAIRWAGYYFEAMRIAERYPEKSVLISYEKLCRNREEELAKLRDIVGDDCSSQDAKGFENYNVSLEPWKKNSSSAPEIKDIDMNISGWLYVLLGYFERAIVLSWKLRAVVRKKISV